MDVAGRLRGERFECFCAAGREEVLDVMRHVTETLVQLDDITPDIMKRFSAHVRSAFRAMMHERCVRGSLSTDAAERRPRFVWEFPARIAR